MAVTSRTSERATRSGLSDLEKRIEKLRFTSLLTMRDSVREYCQRVRSATLWDENQYPRGTEKELYAQFAHILLVDPKVTVPSFLQLFQTSAAEKLTSTLQAGEWRAYRVSTRRFDRGRAGPHILPGGSGSGGIADVALLLNPRFEEGANQVNAELILYFEIKSRDHHAQENQQIDRHLKAIEREPGASTAYLAGLGGRRRTPIEHPRWLGHVSLDEFLLTMARLNSERMISPTLGAEITQLQQVLIRPHSARTRS